MKGLTRRPPQGELRQSQVITTFGPGAMLDLPSHSVLVGGLDFWTQQRRRLHEERLTARICDLLGVPGVALYEPPIDDPDPRAPRSGITTMVFPTWFLAQVEEAFTDQRGKQYRTRPLIPWGRLTKGGYLTPDKKIAQVVPVRFVRACVHGHIDDIDWYAFVRGTFDTPRTGQLWLDEAASGGDFTEIYVRCETTGLRRPLADATIPDGKLLGKCPGKSPWLGPRVHEPCSEYSRLLIRSASNAYFAQTLSVIAIPDRDAELRKAVDRVHEDFLQYCEDQQDVVRERRKQKVLVALEGFSDAAVWAEVQRRRSPLELVGGKSIKQAEIETLLDQPSSPGEDVPDGDFFARTRPLDGLSAPLRDRIERIVLVHRLREVIAQIGFTRFEAALPDIDGELSLKVQLAPLARELSWLPGVENRGEGIFIAFRREAIQRWLDRQVGPTGQPVPVLERGRQLDAGFMAWRQKKKVGDATFPGLPYIMLHTLSHLLITAVSLECGYAASSIRERIYAGDYGYGILLYTGSSGSEGTLGGLVQVGRRIEVHLRRALELGRLCSSDPVCAQHMPSNAQEERFLHGAACHGCLLIAETSCERRNELLDRALVVPTVAGLGAEFFPTETWR